ncbi:MAG: DUF5722 domain-containing protein [Eubacteriales bacterium]|nr:DUF5722 domain-containing protein [Eubacteriales bacterium]
MSQQDMFDDIQALGVDQVVCNLSSAQSLDSLAPFARKCRDKNITLIMILLNSADSRNKALLPVSSPVSSIGNYAFNADTAEGEQAVRSYARDVASFYADTVSNWGIGNEINDGAVWDYNGIADINAHAASYAKANPYVDGFYLSRQVDAASQLAIGGAFGLWTRDESAGRDEIPKAKKKVWYTYQSLQ